MELGMALCQGGVKDVAEARDRRADILAAIKDNERELSKFKAEIASNEEARRDIQARIDRLITNNHNVAFLNLMSTFRLQVGRQEGQVGQQAVRLEELKFQMAVRDQVIGEQREVISNLWRIIDKSGLGKQRVIDIARSEGIIMDGLLMPLQAVRLEELKFQMAVRDQVIGEQREVISNLWRIIDKSGLGKQRVIDIARSEGIIMDGLLMPLQQQQ
ncbi:kinesin motor domain-containing protein [Haematococcus lacustris]|uniref:Kinesin motor domain-containing protein n=1 Tax=Haematococcus lacustris TaxID=44745 RepID=A0A699ZZA9_HAELA|nr:kinesin motor domain-containing protein [Haematococcus lacustris]